MTQITINTGAQLVGLLKSMDPVNGVTINISGIDIKIPMSSIMSVKEIGESPDKPRTANIKESKPKTDYASIVKTIEERASSLSEESRKLCDACRKILVDYMQEEGVSSIYFGDLGYDEIPKLIVPNSEIDFDDLCNEGIQTEIMDIYYSDDKTIGFHCMVAQQDYEIESGSCDVSACEMAKLVSLVVSGKGDITYEN